jgi:hypothetical protein
VSASEAEGRQFESGRAHHLQFICRYRIVKIAKPLLLTTTPIGLIGGLYEGYRLAGGLVLIMIALICFMSAAMGSVILTIRRERAAELKAAETATATAQSRP